MSRIAHPHNSTPILAAAEQWVQRCLVSDGSVFTNESIWTLANLDALDRFVVQQPDAGEGSFYEKLELQVAGAPPEARKLMSELLWALLLFPSNITEDMKRESFIRVWGWSGDSLNPGNPFLDDAVLDGIGSAGMGINTNRWREVNYFVALGKAVKQLAETARHSVLSDYDRFMEWIATVPTEGDRQFRHMLRYFLFPDRVERMSSNGDRRRVLLGFGVAPIKVTRKWTDRQLDDALLKLRVEQEDRFGTTDLDFYQHPLREEWQKPNDTGTEEPEEDSGIAGVNEPTPTIYVKDRAGAKNLILYGPPGTGKTYRLQQMQADYTDQPADIDRPAWELQLVAAYGWRAVLAAALADIGKPTKVADFEGHSLIRAKAAQRNRKGSVRPTMWGYLQEHASREKGTVNVATHRPPYSFEKDVDSYWSLVSDWQDQDGEAFELHARWVAGPAKNADPVKRYRVVTFHPSYSYEDFVIGLRPVGGADTGGAVGFRMVDGVFKQACADALANPGRRHALFIDEINRADIAKVFGELITLIEPDKRARYDAAGNITAGMEVQLPGTGAEEGEDERFGVPENLDIIGTMNTADRSIALLDIALRRRFEFREIGPDYSVIARKVEEVELSLLLKVINDRIEFLADRDRLIGHAYFSAVRSIVDLRAVFQGRIIPLLQEYFFDDWSRVEMVLSNGTGRSVFIARESLDAAKLFSGAEAASLAQRYRYRVTEPSGWGSLEFLGICQQP
ncbi:MAG: restriction endonuclease [Lysobacteraceae bacterium]|nr:MAG: restriction endonuclease [Xanthomonadaceae bacterium]